MLYSYIPNVGEKGHTLLATESTVLFCGLILKPRESKNGECAKFRQKHPPMASQEHKEGELISTYILL